MNRVNVVARGQVEVRRAFLGSCWASKALPPAGQSKRRIDLGENASGAVTPSMRSSELGRPRGVPATGGVLPGARIGRYAANLLGHPRLNVNLSAENISDKMRFSRSVDAPTDFFLPMRGAARIYSVEGGAAGDRRISRRPPRR
jgi:hypothetical protein